jgi:F0F1-type ATP synthase membrane subunit b/b'
VPEVVRLQYHTTKTENKELLKAMKEMIDADREERTAESETDKEQRKAEREAIRKKRKQEIKASQDHLKEEIKTQMASLVSRMDIHQEKMEATIHFLRAWRKEMMACQ